MFLSRIFKRHLNIASHYCPQTLIEYFYCEETGNKMTKAILLVSFLRKAARLSETSVAWEVFSKLFQVEMQTNFNFLKVGEQRANIEVTVYIGEVINKTDVCKSSITVGALSTMKLESADTTSLGKGSFSNFITFPFQ